MSLIQPALVTSIAVLALTMSTQALAAPAETFANGRSWFGVPVSSDQARLVVDVRTTEFINIKCGDVVTFQNGSASFTWRFDVLNHGRVDARKVAPNGFMSGALMVYVRPNDYERN